MAIFQQRIQPVPTPAQQPHRHEHVVDALVERLRRLVVRRERAIIYFGRGRFFALGTFVGRAAER